MKLVAILGSPRGMQGNTGRLLDGMLQGARAAGAECQTFSLAGIDVQPCRSCERCHLVGDCPIDDDFDEVQAALGAADGLIVASPNYIMNVSAQTKALLDRCSGLIHTQQLDGKYAAVAVTSGSGGGDAVSAYLLSALRMIGYLGVGSIDALGSEIADPSKCRPHLEAAATLGRRLVEAIRTRQTFPDQQEERRLIMARMEQLVRMRGEDWAYEYEYWTKRQAL